MSTISDTPDCLGDAAEAGRDPLCRAALLMPDLHVCTRRDGRIVRDGIDDCWTEARRQVLAPFELFDLNDRRDFDADAGAFDYLGGGAA